MKIQHTRPNISKEDWLVNRDYACENCSFRLAASEVHRTRMAKLLDIERAFNQIVAGVGVTVPIMLASCDDDDG